MIRCIGVNQGEANALSGNLYGLQLRVADVAQGREKLMMVHTGGAMWLRDREYGSWEFIRDCFDYQWPWLFKVAS